MRSIDLFLTILIVFLFVPLAAAQEKTTEVQKETNTELKELSDFHEIIYPIWHTAYPAKDITALKGFVPEVNAKAKKIYSLKLPGIFRERAEKWKAGLKVFKASVKIFNKVTKGSDTTAILSAAEKLHGNYEMLVRAVKPFPKEVDAFHKELYVVYHKYLPAKNYEKIIGVCDLLITKAENIKTAKLSKKVEPKKEEFQKAADDLISACKELKASTKQNFQNLVENMHSKYEKVTTFFD